MTFIRYLKDFIKHGEFGFILTAIKYQLFNVPAKKNKLYKSSLGTFYTRKGSLDFMFANYAYEWNVKRFVLNHYRDYNVFFDLGANIGTYCIMMANEGLKCFAFEPSRSNFEVMKKNIALNNLDERIRFFPFGLGKTEGTVKFVFNPVNTGASHLNMEKMKNNGIREKIKIKALDAIYKDFNLSTEDRIFMKIDVEGMEIDLIQGAHEFLSEFPNLLIIIEKKHADPDLVMKEMNSIGTFKYQSIDKFNMAIKKIKSN